MGSLSATAPTYNGMDRSENVSSIIAEFSLLWKQASMFRRHLAMAVLKLLVP
jgi:hypothetical protein